MVLKAISTRNVDHKCLGLEAGRPGQRQRMRSSIVNGNMNRFEWDEGGRLERAPSLHDSVDVTNLSQATLYPFQIINIHRRMLIAAQLGWKFSLVSPRLASSSEPSGVESGRVLILPTTHKS